MNQAKEKTVGNTNLTITCECHPAECSGDLWQPCVPFHHDVNGKSNTCKHIREGSYWLRDSTDLRENNNNNIKHLRQGGTAKLLPPRSSLPSLMGWQRGASGKPQAITACCTATLHRPTVGLPARRLDYIHGAQKILKSSLVH